MYPNWRLPLLLLAGLVISLSHPANGAGQACTGMPVPERRATAGAEFRWKDEIQVYSVRAGYNAAGPVALGAEVSRAQLDLPEYYGGPPETGRSASATGVSATVIYEIPDVGFSLCSLGGLGYARSSLDFSPQATNDLSVVLPSLGVATGTALAAGRNTELVPFAAVEIAWARIRDVNRSTPGGQTSEFTNTDEFPFLGGAAGVALRWGSMYLSGRADFTTAEGDGRESYTMSAAGFATLLSIGAGFVF